MTARIIVLAAITSCLPAAAGAQSLVDIAHAEEARRAKIAKPARVYSNTDLDRLRFPDALSAPVVAPPTAPAETASTPADQAAAIQPGSRDSTEPFDDRDASYWQVRREGVAMRVSRSNQDISGLLTRLTAPGLSSSERALIRTALDEAQSDLSELQAEKTALENDARRAVMGAKIEPKTRQ